MMMMRRTHNDASPSGRFAQGLGEVDLYMWDSYPQGFDCADPTSWPEINTAGLDSAHKVRTNSVHSVPLHIP